MNIRDYWIDELKEVKEFDLIGKIEDEELLSIKQALKDMIDNQFISSSMESGIARREKILGIVPFKDDSPETRRFRITSMWNAQPPYTYESIIKRLNKLCGESGYEIELNHGEYTLTIKVELTQKRMLDEVKKTTRLITPANILLKVELKYNQYSKLSEYSYDVLQGYDYGQLRNEVIKSGS